MPEDPAEMVARTQREAARRFAQVWGELVRAGASFATGQPGETQRQLQAAAQSAAAYAGMAVEPLRGFIDGQRELAERMTAWADLQHQLADQIATWARQQRDFADSMDRWLEPFAGLRPAAPDGPDGTGG